MRRLRGCGVFWAWALILALVVGLAGTARAGWDGTQEVSLGDRFGAVFSGDGGETHEFSFYAPSGTKATFRLQVGAGSDLAPTSSETQLPSTVTLVNGTSVPSDRPLVRPP